MMRIDAWTHFIPKDAATTDLPKDERENIYCRNLEKLTGTRLVE